MSPQNQHQPIDRQRRVRRLAGLLVLGGIVATGVFALPALAANLDEVETAATTVTTATESTTTTELATTTTTAAPETTTTTVPLSPEEELLQRFATMTDEEKAAFDRYTAPTTTTTTAPPPPPTTTTTAPRKAATGGSSPPNAFLACVRQRESGGNYSINTGNGYYGAYQFSQSTWDNTARHAGRGDLVGVRPSNVSPAEQDAMALHLYNWYGRSPWAGPGC